MDDHKPYDHYVAPGLEVPAPKIHTQHVVNVGLGPPRSARVGYRVPCRKFIPLNIGVCGFKPIS